MRLYDEIQYFEQNREKFQKDYPGKFLLIYDRKLQEVCEDEDTAVKVGFKLYGTQSEFLVKKADEKDETPMLFLHKKLQCAG